MEQIFSAKAFEAFETVHKQQVHGLLKQLYLASMTKNSVNIAELAFMASGNIEMFVAGTKTTSSTFEWGMAEILRKPDAYKKIVMELDQVVGKDRFVEESDISNLPYLPAAVKEVFWLHPAIPLLVPRSMNEACEVSWVKHRCERP
ncbi:hypothetical protein ACE6H2_025868 [Prunus campanulata]